MAKWLFLIIALVSSSTLAQLPPDQPGQDESFSTFFRRITTSGSYVGITLNPPPTIQAGFLNWFRLGPWVGLGDKASRALKDQGVDLWLGWYLDPMVVPIIFPGPTLETFRAQFEIRRQAECPTDCRPLSILQKTEWPNWTTPERENFTITFVTDASIFSGKTMLDILAERFGISAQVVKARTTPRLLSHADFVTAVRALGWTGDVYFRGITTVDPKQPNHDVILLDDEFLRTKTEYSQPIFQALELVGTLVHEFGHAFQDAESEGLGIDLFVGSLAGSLLIEGDAEYNAEQTMFEASKLMPSPNPLALYAAEQAIGIMDKDSQPEFIPYRVGLPLEVAVKTGKPVYSSVFRMDLYQTIVNKMSLDEFLEGDSFMQMANFEALSNVH